VTGFDVTGVIARSGTAERVWALMNSMRLYTLTRFGLCAGLISAAACAGGRAVEHQGIPAPERSAAGEVTPAGGPSEEDAVYIKMAVAATSQLHAMANGRTIGLYQTNSKSSTIRGIVNALIEVYGFHEVHPGEDGVQCTGQKRRAPTMSDALPICTINIADMLWQVNSVQMTRDSGFVGGLLTEAVKGDSRPRTTGLCVMATRHGNDWVGVRWVMVPTPRDCAQDRKH
jgi:hypothetical protein